VIRRSFNDGWRFRPKVNAFAELLGGASPPWSPVRLPHDAMLGGGRDPEGRAATGFFPGGVWEYEKTFVVPDEQRGQLILVEFEGVYRSATVYVNGTLVGHRPYGYSNFSVSVGEHLRYGEENTIRVDAIAHDDARWYSGAGIYRSVHVVIGRPLHVALDGVHVTTPSVDDDGAVVSVDTMVENDSRITTTTTVTTEIVDHTGALVARDDAPLTVFPGRAETLRQRLFVAHPRRWSVDRPALYTCRTWSRATATSWIAHRPGSASAPWRSTRSAACASTAKGWSYAARASTTTTASSGVRPSPGPTSGGSRSSRTPGSMPCAVPTIR
jgi:beta-galactosidase